MQKVHSLFILLLLASSYCFALTIGYYDNSRNSATAGFDSSFLTQAGNLLTAQGHSLVSTSNVDSSFLNSVEAFYLGRVDTLSDPEINDLENFVKLDGKFLYVQADNGSSAQNTNADRFLSEFGITLASGGTSSPGSSVFTQGNSDWVTTPHQVNSFFGAVFREVLSAPIGFENLAQNSNGNVSLGVLEAGPGQTGTLLVSTDFESFSSSLSALSNTSNQQMWENIWTTAEARVNAGPAIPETSTLGLLLVALGLVTAKRILFIS